MMNSNRKNAALGAHVRRLCSSGLNPKVVIPPVVAALRELVRAEWGFFYFADAQFELSDVYSENPAFFDVLPQYLAEIHNSPAQDVLGVRFSDAMRRGRGYGNTDWYGHAVFEGAGYEYIMRPLGIRHALEQTASYNGRGWGAIQLQRPPGSRPFSEHDEATLAIFRTHLAHALTAPDTPVTDYAASGSSGVLVTDATGKLLLASPEALQCVALANGGPPGFCGREQVPLWLRALIANFVALWNGQDRPPCLMVRRNSTGLFRIRAYCFDEHASNGDLPTIAVHVEHYPPLALQVETLGFRFGLSERQRDLCGDLLEGLTYAEVSRRRAIRESTVVTHAREMFRKLEIHDRAALHTRFPSLGDSVLAE
ncbi:helix-turn-helix transcriptional regulator [Paraburkholderia sp. J10-1]|uniref:helix-turn-helix domain-containing protein n=1 Tax=Paraburkholderia sp. J10-1 TaxID=2805430 RepID=UPI002AB7DE47|nr:helix-turn-helix transcriptional regulator [Paraburkholderia sp. J10-1]